MNNYRILIQYDGARYKGWQRLGNGENTIQGKLENILSEQLGKYVEVTGSSRTDAGVHAIAQVAHFKTDDNLTVEEVKNIFNRYLPNDISVQEVSLVSERFHARYHAVGKCYLYKIWNRDSPNPFLRKYSTHITEKCDIEEMRKAATYFIGKHDFTAFSTASSKKKSMVREIYSLTIVEHNGLIQIRIKGNSFLYNMVRRIVGLLIEVGIGNVKVDEVFTILNSKERNQAGYMAEAKGLFLEKVEY